MNLTQTAKQLVKFLLSDINTKDWKWVQLPDGGWRYLEVHDQDHVRVAYLPPVRMGNHMVNGINGIDIEEFHSSAFTPEYDGLFDECLVGLHQLFFYGMKPITLVRVGYYTAWLAVQGINPIAVLYRTWKAKGSV